MTVEERLVANGYDDDVLLFRNEYDDAVIGMTTDDRVVYDFDLMVECAMKSHDEAVSWVEHNALGAIPYMGDASPVVINRLRDIEIVDHTKDDENYDDDDFFDDEDFDDDDLFDDEDYGDEDYDDEDSDDEDSDGDDDDF